ncbi:glutathione peroxidase [Novipirellula artificiosorum]|uniref:Glutathione peroxidase n=2 Tax=Novipirellula artificiosorum TaxID=2528016 RepID=A0A5C6DJ05_9BACT|nr:glutathione peroxidase [Novipirellula artificiosorum]TWU36084.1 Hydroperoxy fatty acid reductase gpx1 [Novipirellula artificiosorum]
MRLMMILFLALGAMIPMSNADDTKATTDHECALNFKVKNIDGENVDLEDYEGKVVLIVNTASKCGLTPQYAGLEDLFKKYEENGFVVLGFPCNQFAGQEPGSEAEIKEFCSTKYKVTFPMFSKIEVNGDGANDLYKYLTSKKVEPVGDGKISWNFEKFLVDRDGQLVNRFGPRTTPSDPDLLKAIEAELQ